MKWYDVKLATLQKMFSADTTEIVIDDTTKPYLAAMPGAANTCLNLIATTVRHIPASIVIEQDGTETGIKKYNLKELQPNYYAIRPSEVYFETDTCYGRTYDYRLENTDIFVLDGGIKGKWTIYCDLYPDEITTNTADDYELPVYPEVAHLVSLYIASQLYKDDDIQISTLYYNEFVSTLEDIRKTSVPSQTEGFVSTKGWY